jgi:pimeloyl-ACP methyl ester carboxylesterase
LGTVREVRLAQGVIRYRECGTGEPIVFIHGLLVNGDLWRKVVPTLAEHFRCITPDLPLGSHEVAMAHDSDLTPPGLARMIADFIAALDLDGVTLVANDTGGALAQILVTQHPQRIARLVLTSCDSFDNFLPPMFRYLQWGARIPGAVFCLMQTLRLRSLARLPNTFGWLAKRPIDRDAYESYTMPVLADREVRRDLIKVLRGISSRHTLAAAELLHNFEAPVLLAWSSEDRFFPMAHAVELSRRFPNAQLAPIDDAYTFASEDQPQGLAQRIAGFMRDSRRLRRVS